MEISVALQKGSCMCCFVHKPSSCGVMKVLVRGRRMGSGPGDSGRCPHCPHCSLAFTASAQGCSLLSWEGEMFVRVGEESGSKCRIGLLKNIKPVCLLRIPPVFFTKKVKSLPVISNFGGLGIFCVYARTQYSWNESRIHFPLEKVFGLPWNICFSSIQALPAPQLSHSSAHLHLGVVRMWQCHVN